MNVERLITMANQIGDFHATLPDRSEALNGTATHIRRFWDPRMRRALYAYLDQGGGGLNEIALEALTSLRSMVEPPPVAVEF